MKLPNLPRQIVVIVCEDLSGFFYYPNLTHIRYDSTRNKDRKSTSWSSSIGGMGTDVTGFRLKRTLSNELGLYRIRETHTILGSGLSMTLQGARGRFSSLGGPQWVPALPILRPKRARPGRI